MDNLAHTLMGAALAEAGLKKKTGLGLPALMIAANIPDVDVIGLLFGENLAWRRGLTHGPLGLLILPALTAWALWAFDRWQARRGKRPEKRLPVHFGWLLALCYMGAITHPLLDLMNTYGVRLLSPFSERWFYGDTLFIIDVWMWTLLTIGVVWSQVRGRRGSPRIAMPAQAATAVFLAYVGGMFWFSQTAEAGTARAITEGGGTPELVVASPPPGDPFSRGMIYRTANQQIGWGEVSLGDNPTWVGAPVATNMDDPRIAEAAAQSKPLRDFLFWSRMPFARFEGDTVIVSDARYSQAVTNSTFTVSVDLSRPPTE